MLLEKLEKIEDKFNELNLLMSDPAVVADREKYQAYAAEHSELSPLLEKGRDYKKTREDLASAEQILLEDSDEELQELPGRKKRRRNSGWPRSRRNSSLCSCRATSATTKTS